MPSVRVYSGPQGSGDDVMNDVAFDIGQAEVAAGVAVGEAFVIEAEQVQDRGVQVVNVDLVLGRVVAVVVGAAVAQAALHAAAGQPHRKAFGVVVAAVFAFDDGSAAEFAAPPDQRVIQEAAGLEILEQAGDRQIDLAGVLLVPVLQVGSAGPTGLCCRCA